MQPIPSAEDDDMVRDAIVNQNYYYCCKRVFIQFRQMWIFSNNWHIHEKFCSAPGCERQNFKIENPYDSGEKQLIFRQATYNTGLNYWQGEIAAPALMMEKPGC